MRSSSIRFATVWMVLATFFALVAQGPTPSGVFHSDTSMAAARDGASAAVLPDGRVLMIGGKDANGNLLATAEYLGTGDPAGSMTYARSGHTSVVLADGRVLVSGGIQGSNDAQIFDPASGQWSPSFPLGQTRVGGTATLLSDGRVLFAGGDGTSMLEIYDPASGQVSNAANMSSARKNHAATLLRDGRVVIAGGSTIDGGGNVVLLPTIDIYDPATNTVTAGPAMAAAREHLSATTLMEQQVLLAGGAGVSTEILDVAAGSMVPGPAMAAARSGQVALLLPNNNTVLMAAGAGSPAAEIYVPWTNQFQPFGTLANVRAGAPAGAAYSNDFMVAGQARIAGGSVNGVATNAVEAVQFPTVLPDKWDYQPGDTVHLYGAGFTPGQWVSITWKEVPLPTEHHEPIAPVQADASGAFSADVYLVSEHDLGIRFYVTATDTAGVTAGTTFTDSLSITAGGVTIGAQSPSPVVTGNTATYPISVKLNGSATTGCNLALSVTGLPGGATGSFSPNPIPISGSPTSVSSTLTVTAGTTSGVFTVSATTPNNPGQCVPGTVNAVGGLSVAVFPDLKVTVNNNATANTVVYGTSWVWTVRGSNTGTATASFAAGQTIVTDNLPNTTIGYGSVSLTPSGTTGTISCSVVSSTFTCTAATAVTIPVNASFSATFLATATAIGTYADPRPLGICAIDPNNNITESNEGNNTCSNTMSVTVKSVSVTPDAASKVYGDMDPAFTGTLNGFVGSDNVTATYTRTAGETVAGSPYTISATLNPAAVLTNYNITYNTANFTITRRPASVTPDPASKVYGSMDPVLTGTLTEFVAGDGVTATYTRTAGETVLGGPYTISATLSPAAVLANYTITYDTALFTITQKPASVTPAAASKIYGDADPAFSGALSGFLAGDGVSAAYSRTAGETVLGGPYTISATLSPAGVLTNYSITYNTAAFTINPKPASVTPAAASKTYGDPDPPLTGALNGFLAGDGVSAAYSRTAGETVLGGPYTISAILSPAGVLTNYTITYNTAVFTINPKPASVTPNAASKTYGDVDPALSGTLLGFLSGDGVSATYSRTAGETVLGGPYTISATLVPTAVLTNYTVTYNTALFTINARVASVTPNTATKIYGDADPALTGTLSGFLPADGVSAVYSRTAGETVAGSPYTISAVLSPAAVLTNYAITYNTAAFTITQRLASVSPAAASKTYGDADPALTGTLTGFLAGDAVTAVYSRTAGETVAGSPYTISAVLSPAAVLTNYAITYNTANFTINLRPASVTPAAASKMYGDADPALTGVLAGFLPADGVSAVYSRTAGEAVAGSPYTISAVLSPAAVLSNYSITYNTAAFTINPRLASVTPAAASKTYGDADPALTGGLAGFLPADGVSAVYSRTAGETVAGSPYTISAVLSPAGALGNYTITYNTATFTINPKPASVTPNVASKTYGDADPAFTGTLSGFLASDSVTATYSRTPGETVAGSPYTISATLSPAGVLTNYAITYNTAAFTIHQRPASVTPNAASKTYGDADPAFTGALSGFLASDSVTATYSRTAGEAVAGSPYTISATLGPVGVLGNYAITYHTAAFTIYKATLTIHPDNQSRPFFTANPALTFSFTGFKLGENAGTAGVAGSPSLSTTATTASPVGSYPITCDSTGSLSAANYNFLCGAPGTLLVAPRPTLTSIAVSSPINEGQTTVATVTVTDVLGGLTPTGTVTLGPSAAALSFSAAGCTLVAGTCHVNVTGKDDFNAPLTASYAGDATHFPSNGAAAFVVNNVLPVIGGASADPVSFDTSATVNVSFTDAGVLDTHTCAFSAPISYTTSTLSAGVSSCSTTVPNPNPGTTGVYPVTVTVTDDNGGSASLLFYLVFYDADAGFVTGGGWIDSPAGAYVANPALVGKATFGFEARYKKGATIPDGNTEFQFQAAGLLFKSTSYDYLVVQGQNKAQYKGHGTINGTGDYQFLVSVVDGSPDRFRIKINQNGGGTIYDNLMGALDDATPTTAVGGGNIVIHAK